MQILYNIIVDWLLLLDFHAIHPNPLQVRQDLNLWLHASSYTEL
jgi:hypothetical protein